MVVITELPVGITKGVMEELTIEQFRDLWTRTYNRDGKPDWSHIMPYYHEDIIFMDSIQRIEGKQEFIALCERLTNRCQQLDFEILTLMKENNQILFDWKMVMSFNKYPSTPVFGCTKLVFGEDNRIIEQRDYFDLWGDIFNGIPYFKRLYRNFMHKYFG